MAFVIVLGTATAITVTTASPAQASTGGYPWYNATTLNQADYDWGYATCPSSDTGCKSPFSMTINGVTYGESDPWAYYLRNCTSFVAWKLTSQGVSASAVEGLGNGGDWYNSAPASERSLTAAPGDAAVQPGTGSNPYGHVAYVDSVSGSNITIEEYNYAGTGAWDTRTGTPSALGFSEFVNFGLNPSAGWGGTNAFRAAFQANTSSNYLYLFDSSSGTMPTTQGMMTGTSPAITALSNGYEEAFQAAGTGNLYVNGSNSSGNTQQGMASGTSPSISALPSSANFEAAFQANNGYLYTYSSATGSATNTGLGMMSGTSPSIAALAGGGYEVCLPGQQRLLVHVRQRWHVQHPARHDVRH